MIANLKIGQIMYLFLTLIALSSLFAQTQPAPLPDNKKIGVQNGILAKVNDTAFSVIDVKKKLDLLFYQNYSHLSHSNEARFQFYESGWRPALMQMIDNELILADAATREVKLSDGEVREEMENRFGPNVLATLEQIHISYDEAWKMVKNDLIVQRMNWWFIQSKAIQNVTPQDIRQSYQTYLEKNPSYEEFKYQVISIRSENPTPMAEKIYAFLATKQESPESLMEEIKKLDPSVQISSEYTVKDKELSESYKTTLSSLSPKSYAPPTFQVSRADKQTVARIFYLNEKKEYLAPSFSELSHKLKNDLIQQSISKESVVYLEKLRKQYGFDIEHLKESFPADMHPFSIQ
jgi:hypothetical protein